MLDGLMNNPQVIETLRSVVAPAAGGIVVMLALWRPWRKGSPAPMPIASALGLGAAFIAAYIVAHGWHGWYPTDTTRRIVYAGLIGIVVAGIETWPRGHAVLRHTLRLLASAAVVWILTEHRRRTGAWEGMEVALWTGLWSLTVWLWVEAANNLGKRSPGVGWPLLLSVPALALSLVAFMAGAASFSQHAGLLVAWMHAAFLVGLLWRSMDLTRGAATVFGLGAGGLLVLTYTSVGDDTPRLALGVLALAPLALLIPRLKTVARRKPLVRFAITASVLAALGGASLGLTAWSQRSGAGGDDDDVSRLYGRATVAAAPPTLA